MKSEIAAEISNLDDKRRIKADPIMMDANPLKKIRTRLYTLENTLFSCL